MATGGYYSSREQSPKRDTHDQRQSYERSSTSQNGGDNSRKSVRQREGSTSLSTSTATTGTAKLNGAPPLHDTINNAVRNTDTANLVPADLVAQITEEVTNSVLNRLKASGMSMTADETEAPYQPVPVNLAHPQSPTNSTTTSIPRQYTPPSPPYENMSHRSASPEPAISEASSSSNTSKTDRRRSNASPPRGEAARPKPARVPTAIHEATILEKVWRPLFTDGQPTARLGEFLRGLALHLINDFEPKHSLVVTPAKMSDFFREVAQPDEVYPFPDIFGGRCTNLSISRLYQTLKCQHHFIQRSDEGEPTIPALTPQGFASFMTILIQAHPDREYDRLAKAVLNMPISNADLPTERFPKEISRRLFPADEDRACAQKLYIAISADRNIPLRNSNPIPPPPSQPPPVSTSFERERNPYHSTPTANSSATTSVSNAGSSFTSSGSVAFDDEELRAPQLPIERERQPYTAREGTGKIREDSLKEYQQQQQQQPQSRPRESAPPSVARPNRSNSTAPAPPSYVSSSGSMSRPMDVPPPTNARYHRSSMNGVRPNFSTPSAASSAGAAINSYAKSEGANINDIPREYYASNIHGVDSRDTHDDQAREDARRYVRRENLNEESSSVGSTQSHRYSMPPARTNSQHGYEYNNPSSGRDPRDVYDDRRRSMYPGTGTGAGTDGYGSYSQPRY